MTPADVKRWRASLGLTQVEAAALLGYGKSQYIAIEMGHPEGEARRKSPIFGYALAATAQGLKPWPKR